MRDIVPCIDLTGRKRCKDTIVILISCPKAHLHDDNVINPTYAGNMRIEIKD